MKALSVLLAFLCSFAAQREAAACSSSTGLTGYGDFVVRREGSTCDCAIYQPLYECGTRGSAHRLLDEVLVDTVSGDCDTACEDLPGYDDAVALALANQSLGSGAFECDSVRYDRDGDGV